MNKKTLLLLTFPLLLLAIYSIFSTPTRIKPYPYAIKTKYHKEVINNAQNSDILIIGDRMGNSLANFSNDLQTKVSKNLVGPLKVFNWTSKHEALPITLHKLSKLKKLPQIVIFHGSSSEFYGNFFQIDQHKKIQSNLRRYKTPWISSMIMLFPLSSKLFYLNESPTIFKDPPPKNTISYSSVQKQNQMEITYNLFKLQMDDLLHITSKKNSNLIVLTTPINLKIRPKKNCGNSTTPSIDNFLTQIENDIKVNKTKKALKNILELESKVPSNAQIHFLKGIIFELHGKQIASNNSLRLAAAFDCDTWRSNEIFNSIIRKTNNNHTKSYHLIDFAKMVEDDFGSPAKFLDEIYPQDLYYNKVIDKISVKITEILEI